MRFWSYDGCQIEWHDTEESARTAAEQALAYCREEARDEGWPDWTDSIRWGKTLGEAVEVNRQENECDCTEEEREESGEAHGYDCPARSEFSHTCGYELQEVKP